MKKIKKHTRRSLRLFLTGFGMGTSDIIPGVSGGTIAFIFGIYEELIFSIKKVTGETVRLLLKGKLKEAILSVPFIFLTPLFLGIGTAFVTLASLLTYLLESYPVYVWSFFFGLVFASILVIRKRVVTWDLHDIVIFILASVGAYFLVGIVPVETPRTVISFFLSGSIAVVAMILPGISGSFILVLLGKYEQVLGALVARDAVFLGAVLVGAVIGIAVFSRILSWLFSKHHDIAIVTLSGFMLGSLRKIWPWKKAVETKLTEGGKVITLQEANILPEAFNLEVVFAVSLAILAALLMLYLDSLQATREEVSDIEDEEFAERHKKALKTQV